MSQILMGRASMGLENLVSETFARLDAAPAARLAEADYRSFADALGASERGRAFLHEYARRNRHADTEVVLAALSRLEQTARAHQAEPEAERIRQDLRALLETLHRAKPQIDSSPGAIKAATLAAMLEFVQARLEALISPRTTLKQVPAPEQPELPIPQPAPMPAVLSLVQTRFNKIIPEVSFFDGAAAPMKPAAENEAAPMARAPIPAAEPVKPAVEPYELWLDPGLAGLARPAQKPVLQAKIAEAHVDARVVAQVEADLTAGSLTELPPAPVLTESPPKHTTAQPTTALAALAATFIKSDEAKPAPSAKATALKTDDPLALIMALSEAERLALFT